MKKYVYNFNEGKKEMKHLLGGKGANLAEMTNLGLSVPPGFTITTEACIDFYDQNEEISEEMMNEIKEHVGKVEEQLGKKFADKDQPLLFSVRSGAVVSMPGMMDTILNLGLNDETVQGLARSTNNERFAYDSYRRFIQMFSDVAMGISKSRFDLILDSKKEEKGYKEDPELTAEDLKEIIKGYKEIYLEEKREEFPQDPMKQLYLAVKAVFSSWNNARAFTYRNLNGIPHNLGTAVNVQSMVFGNMGNDSGTGVAFSRNPADGENRIFGEFLMNAQGEDVVAGIRTPKSIDELKQVMPAIYEEFISSAKKLENHYRDMQDIEFTIQNEKLYFLQTRNGKRTAKAAINVAVDLVEEGLISKEEAVLRIESAQLDNILHPNFDEKALKSAEKIAKGLPASPGAASGKVYFTAEAVVEAQGRGEACILVRQETSPEDIEGMNSAEGILTARGGMTSHAAVVARGMGKCCVAGCQEIRVDEAAKVLKYGNKTLKEGDVISLNGSTGEVYLGDIKKVNAELTGNFKKLMGYIDEIKRLGVRTNADTPKDAKTAVDFGAEGIGLCRTEHMFFNEDRIPKVRRMILAKSVEMREKALAELLPHQREDFAGIYEAMGERPVTVRLLDPPLHEFLPTTKADIETLAGSMGVSFEELKDVVDSLHEVNPMLGHRGCRLAVTYPEIYRMQARAIMEAAIEVSSKHEYDLVPEIMVPLIGSEKELKFVKDHIVDEIEQVFEEQSTKLTYKVGTMIEIPRAAITADEIANEAEFFSFGTNDLTQMGFGFSRDDAGKFLGEYENNEILEVSPFEAIDQKGIGKLMKMAVELGKSTRPDIHLGICGEHGGEPSSVEFCHKIGLDYVSCSPYRVPIAKLAAAQAVIKEKMEG
ncbi:pyruvate, phosphate dikinase [Filifactor villosus]|uniref:Pyruvate, phosphate dikinase n=1 Tax=Filifactor villosus TaxID=29374 RepID=A0ABV9QJW6_9FIRM